MGLLNAVVPREQLLDTAREFAAPDHRQRAARRAGDEAERAAGPLPRRARDQAHPQGGARAARGRRGRRQRRPDEREDGDRRGGRRARGARQGPQHGVREREPHLERRSSRPRTPRRAPRRSPRSARRTGRRSDGRPPDAVPHRRRPADVASRRGRGAGRAGAARDVGAGRARRSRRQRRRQRGRSNDLDALDIVYCQTWQYDDPPTRLADRLGASSRSAATTPASAARRRRCSCRTRPRASSPARAISRWCSAPRRSRRSARYKKRGERCAVLVQARGEAPVPVGGAVPPGGARARGVPGVAHVRDVRQRASRRTSASRSPEYRVRLGRAARADDEDRGREPRRLVPRSSATADDRSSTARPDNRMVGYPYTKYMISIMDVDMAAAVLLASHEARRRVGRPAGASRLPPRVVLRDRPDRTSPSTTDMWRSPAMEAASAEAIARRGHRRRRRRAPRPVQLLRQLGELRQRRARHRATTTRGR